MESTVIYKPKFGRVLIEREVKTTTSGGIILTNEAAIRNAVCEGIIKALGETAGWAETYQDGERVPIQTLKVGQKVIFGRYSGQWLDATYGSDGKDKDDGKLFICQDADIIAVKEQ